ncbi:MAG: class I SAM-dependent methyltransferase [Mycobacteriales bacterium]
MHGTTSALRIPRLHEPARNARTPLATARHYWHARRRDRSIAGVLGRAGPAQRGLNAAWYVDTTLDYDSPDLERFFATGRRIVAEALEGAPGLPAARRLAVEIGCGLGRVCRPLAEQFDSVIGLDIAPEMVVRARRLVAEPNVSFVVCSGEDLQPLGSASADLVLSFTVFQHLSDPQLVCNYVAEIGRVLAPGGLAVLQWNGQRFPGWWALQRRIADLRYRAGIGDDQRGRQAAEFLGSRIPVATMRRWLGQAGLRVLATKGEGTLFSWVWATR